MTATSPVGQSQHILLPFPQPNSLFLRSAFLAFGYTPPFASLFSGLMLSCLLLPSFEDQNPSFRFWPPSQALYPSSHPSPFDITAAGRIPARDHVCIFYLHVLFLVVFSIALDQAALSIDPTPSPGLSPDCQPRTSWLISLVVLDDVPFPLGFLSWLALFSGLSPLTDFDLPLQVMSSDTELRPCLLPMVPLCVISG